MIREQVIRQTVTLGQATTAVGSFRHLVESACLTVGFAATEGNLAASITAAVVSDAMFSGYQRILKGRMAREEEAQIQRVREMLLGIKDMRSREGDDSDKGSNNKDNGEVVSMPTRANVVQEESSRTNYVSPMVSSVRRVIGGGHNKINTTRKNRVTKQRRM